MSEKEIIENEKVANELFARFLCENGLVLSDDILIEYVRNIMDAVSFDNIFQTNTKMIFCDGLKSNTELNNRIINGFGIDNYKINLLSNGFNSHIEKAVKNFLPVGRFNVGICTDDEKEFKGCRYKLVRFSKELIATGVPIDTYEREYGGKRLFLISNRRRINGE